jgi:hypothetical protein
MLLRLEPVRGYNPLDVLLLLLQCPLAAERTWLFFRRLAI